MTEPTAPNAHRLLWAGFLAIFAAGVGFAIRGGILDNWQQEFGFSATQLGQITGAGMTGFCFGIIIGGVIADRIGYGKLVFGAFFLHVISALITFAASVDTNAFASPMTCLFLGSLVFAIANGLLEAVANPLVATVFPHKRTHYLNILHASWPAGLIFGSACGWVLDDHYSVYWKWQLALYMVPTLLYGLMFMGQHMPKSEASRQGLTMGQMFQDVGLLGGLVACFLVSLFVEDLLVRVWPDHEAMARNVGYGIGGVLLVTIGAITRFSLGSILLFVLFITHALVGAVELGTDNWIQNITGNLFTSKEGKLLFVFTSSVMFALRFCTEFIERRLRLSPLGILFVSALLACLGLNLTSHAETFTLALLALTIYGIGKTFFWPTMLAVVSDRFPRSGAVAMSIMGGIGMLSAGMIGSPGLGYFKDRYAAEELQRVDPVIYQEYRSEKPSKFLMFAEVQGLDGKKLGEIAEAKKENRQTEPQLVVEKASIHGDRETLRVDSLIPLAMSLIYLALLAYFRVIGGYRPVRLE